MQCCHGFNTYIIEAHKGSFTMPVIGHLLLPLTRDIEKLFPMKRGYILCYD